MSNEISPEMMQHYYNSIAKPADFGERMLQLTLGSLFDGIGGFPLSGAMHGIRPVWASEIEPFPIAVTMNRFPSMKHLGSVTDINGAEIEPVDILTFGSPCQDLSVAGLQKGIHGGERSNLFFEAIRIIKEMRAYDRATGRTGADVRPRFAVWENVPGAFSSCKGRDFQAVLQALCEVEAPDVSVPFPEDGKWQPAGCIVGEGYSVAWRTYDAQYWGVPQRRKRIYLVADFASGRAGEILFEPEGMRGNPETSGEARKGTTEDAEGSAGGSGGAGVTAFHLQQDPIPNDRIAPCIGGQHQATVGVFMGGQGAAAGSIAYSNDVAPSLKAVPSGSNQVPDVVHVLESIGGQGENAKAADVVPTLKSVEHKGHTAIAFGISSYASNDMKSGNPHSGVYEADTSRTLDLNGGNPSCNQGGWIAVVQSYQTVVGALCMDDYKGPNRQYVDQDKVVVIYDARGNGEGGVSPTLTGDHENRVTDYTAVTVYDTTQITSPLNYSKPKEGDPCHPLASQQHPPLAVCAGNGQLNQISMARQSNTLDCMHDQQIVLTDSRPPQKYIVRRLTPLECCRLQGYPDGWTEGISFDALSEEQISQLEPIRKTWAAINGKQYRPCKDRAALKKWFEGLRTDSAEYKAYGNSLAIPCSSDVLGRIAAFAEQEEE